MPENENENKVIFTPKLEEEGRIDEFPALNPEELQVPQLTTLPVDTAELEAEEKIMEGVEELTEDDLDKRNYLKVSPTFYVQSIETDEVGENGEAKELYKILNPQTNEVETRELTDEEKHEIYVQELKKSRVRFKPIKHNGNITTNQFNSAYKQKRKRRNKLAKASRKANR